MIVDIIIAAVAVLFAFIGWKRGFLLSVYSLLSMVIAVALSCMLSPAVSSLLDSAGLNAKIESGITEYLDGSLADKFGADADVSAEDAANELNLPSFITDKISGSVKDKTHDGIHAVSSGIAAEAADLACRMTAFTVVFILVFIIMVILKTVLKIASRLPVLKQANALLGLIAGIAEGIIVICIFFIILSVFASYPSVSHIASYVEESHIGRLFYDNNIIGHIVSSFL